MFFLKRLLMQEEIFSIIFVKFYIMLRIAIKGKKELYIMILNTCVDF